MNLTVSTIESADAAELYVTAQPARRQEHTALAAELFGAVRDAIESRGARILREQVFGTEQAIERIAPIRAAAYGPLDDGVAPTWLVVPTGLSGELAGLQIHAVRAGEPLEVTRLAGSPCGRLFRRNGRVLACLCGLTAPEAGGPPEQARAMFEKARAALRQLGGDMGSVARTWFWLGDILSWYGEFNRVRNEFYAECGLSCPAGPHRLPASTGVGIRPSGAAQCAMDLVAFLGTGDSVQHLLAGGDQGAASDYGSAFSRASIVAAPCEAPRQHEGAGAGLPFRPSGMGHAGKTVFVSGTAAVDAAGRTEHPGDPRAQIEDTLRHLRAVLDETGCRERDIVQAVAYCKDASVERLFRTEWAGLAWPMLTVIADLCRPDLCFEIEATAAPGRTAPRTCGQELKETDHGKELS